MNKQTILLYGRTNAGKTAQIGVLAEYVWKTLKKKTRLYTGDKGGTRTVLPYIELGIMEAVEMGTSDPWIFLHNAAQGKVRGPDGKWKAGDNTNIGLFAFESLRAIAETLMGSMTEKAGKGINIGGGSNISFKVEGDGESLTISGSNMAHYGVAQSRMTDEVWTSLKLPADYILWTSSVSKDDDTTSVGKVLGPDVIGKALTTEVPRWFDRTFRMDVLPAKGSEAERHILYLGTHVDVGAGNAAGLGNLRMALDAPKLDKLTIEPADIVVALQKLEGGSDVAKEAIRKRLGL